MTFFASQFGVASSFQTDFGYFQTALKMARISTAGLEAFRSPLTGQARFRLNEKDAPWAGNYFPMQVGGIAARWQNTDKSYLDILAKPTLGQLKGMSAEQLNKLSATEKYDIFRRDYKFSTTEHELNFRGPLRLLTPKDWEGFCNGVRCAGILLSEPKYPLKVTNSDGITVNFEPADLKALAGASYFYVEKYAQLGSPTRVGKAESQPNAAIFDMAIRYYLAENKKAFIIDSHLGDEIWNESIVGYSRSPFPAEDLTPEEKLHYPEAAKKIPVRMTLETLSEIEAAQSNKPTKVKVANGEHLVSVAVDYTLYTNSAGNVIDGKWQIPVGQRGVDFVWFGGGRGKDAKYREGTGNPKLNFNIIKRLISKSTKLLCESVFM